MNLYHQCKGHISEAQCCQDIHSSPDFTNSEKAALLSTRLDRNCPTCSVSKQSSRPISKSTSYDTPRSELPGELLCADLIGPIEHPSVGGNRYVLTVTDACTCYHWSVPLRTKGEAAA
jgi:hypothetical protein